MEGRLINIGFGNTVISHRVVAVVMPGSAPMKRLREKATQADRLIDATHGRKTRSIIITDSNHIILSAVHADTLSQRLNGHGAASRPDPGDKDDLGARGNLRHHRPFRDGEDHPAETVDGRGSPAAVLHFLHHPAPAPGRGRRQGLFFCQPGGVSAAPGHGRPGGVGGTVRLRLRHLPGVGAGYGRQGGDLVFDLDSRGARALKQRISPGDLDLHPAPQP